jgi:hypothetical protein
MTALAADADRTEYYNPARMEHGLDTGFSSTQYYKGGMVALDTADGLVKKVVTSTTLVNMGVCIENVLTGAATTRKIRYRTGIFGPFANNGTTIAADDVGKECFAVDDNTVDLTNGGATRSRAGIIYAVTAAGVWVNFTFPNAIS